MGSKARFRGRLLGLLSALLAALPLAKPARASVDMKNSNYADSWIDFHTEELGLRVQRYYNSRAVFNGLFGYGWCSLLEDMVRPAGPQAIEHTTCGAGATTIFHAEGAPAGYDVDRLMTALGRTGRAPAGKEDALRKQLTEYTDLYTEWATFAGSASAALPLGRFVAPWGTLVSTPAGVHVTGIDGEETWFDHGGLLVKKKTVAGLVFTIRREGTHWGVVTPAGTLDLTVSATPVPHVLGVAVAGKTLAAYTYDGDDLATVRNQWNNTWRYEHSPQHHITRVIAPDGRDKRITYNEDRNWVTSFQDLADADGNVCRETYRYEFGPTLKGEPAREAERHALVADIPGDRFDPLDAFSSTAVKKCGRQYTNYASFWFEHRKTAGGMRALARVTTMAARENGDRALVVVYNDEGGTSVVRDAIGGEPSFWSTGKGALSLRTPTGVATYRFPVGCAPTKVVDAWPNLPGMPSHLSITLRYGEGIANGVCRIDRIAVEEDGTVRVLRFHWAGADADEIAVGDTRWSLGEEARALPRFRWVPACLGPAAAREQRDGLVRAMAAARTAGACTPEQLAVASITAYQNGVWYMELPKTQARDAAPPPVTIPEASIPPALRQPDTVATRP